MFFILSTKKQGVSKETLVQGDNVTYPQKGQSVTVHYTGYLGRMGGKMFDKSGQAFTFTLGVGEVIKGWDKGVGQMSLGEKALLTIGPKYAYGSKGSGHKIPPNSTLVFEVELLDIN